MKMTHRLVYLLLVIGLTASQALSQNANSGEIRGTVVDPTGAVIDGVNVTVVNVHTAVKTTLITNSNGIYDAPSVPTGQYTITFSKAGFRDLVRQGIRLEFGPSR